MATILIVEDEPSLRHVMGEHLRRAGHDVAGAANGVEALEHAGRRPFDLIITDMIMPEMEGIETIRELRRRFADLKIIAMSGGGRYDAGEYYLGLAQPFGVVGVLAKPFTSERLLGEVERALAAP